MEQFEQEINLLSHMPHDLEMHPVPGTALEEVEEAAEDEERDGNKESDGEDEIDDDDGRHLGLSLDRFETRKNVIRHIGSIQHGPSTAANSSRHPNS